jgi:hypothetical protein
VAGESIAFVDSVSANPAVRLLLSADPWKVLQAGTDVSPPPLQRLVPSTLLTDGNPIPATAYDNRTITLHLQVRTTAGSTLATQIQLLGRELDRPSNILKWQPDPSIPAVFFRTYRSPDYSPTIEHGLTMIDLTVSILAEPFAIGLLEAIAPVAVQNDPAAGSNGRFLDVTGVKGDVETPLIVKLPGSSGQLFQSLFATRRRGTPSAMPSVLQCESMTMGTDTATQANSALRSGAGNNSTLTTFATSTALVARLSTTVFPASASVDVRGTYRVFLRCSSSTTGQTFNIQLQHGIRAAKNAVVNLATSTANNFCVVDLGLVQLPEGFDPVTDGMSNVQLPVAGVPLTLYVQRVSTTGQLTCDYLYFVPADDHFGIVNWGSTTPTTFVFDGTGRSVYGLDGSGNIADIATAGFVGDPPYVSPGVTNRITFLRDITKAPGLDDPVTSFATLTCSYYPRYLGTVRPLST